MAKPQVIEVVRVNRQGLNRYRVTFDMDWTDTKWADKTEIVMWFDDITCVANDELHAWQIGEVHILKSNLKWRDKSD